MARTRTAARRPSKKAKTPAKPAGKRPCDPKLVGKKLDFDASRFRPAGSKHETIMINGFLDGSAHVAELEMSCSKDTGLCEIKWTRVAHMPPMGGARSKGITQDLSGCGFGTQMYSAAWQFACESGYRLASDDTRSEAAERFWKKQESKGRARCVGTGGNKFDYEKWNMPSGEDGMSLAEYGNQLELRVEAGEIEPADASVLYKQYKNKNETVQRGVWPCRRFEMVESCPRSGDRTVDPYDLRGLRGLRGGKSSCSSGACGLSGARLRIRNVSKRPTPKLHAGNSVLLSESSSSTSRGRRWRR